MQRAGDMRNRALLLVGALLLFCGVCAAQTTVTPNINFQLPYYQQTNWQVPINFDFNVLDMLLGGSVTLPAGATPSITQDTTWITANTGATTITNFVNGFPGQAIHLICGAGDTFTAVASSSTIAVQSSWSCASNQSISFVLIGTVWTEIGRAGTSGGGGGGFGGTNVQTGTSYTAISGDADTLIAFTSGSAATLTLPSTPPSSTWAILVEEVGAGGLTINRNGVLIDGAALNLTLTQNQGLIITTNGTSYYTQRGIGSSGGAAPIGPAGGDLNGTYPNPSVAQINGAAVPLSAALLGTNSSRQPTGLTVLPTSTFPALTGDVHGTAGSLATIVVGINGTSLAGLATGILKNTTGTGVPSIAGNSDIIGTFSGTCNSAAELRGNGACVAAFNPAIPGTIGGTTPGIVNATQLNLPEGTSPGGISTTDVFFGVTSIHWPEMIPNNSSTTYLVPGIHGAITSSGCLEADTATTGSIIVLSSPCGTGGSGSVTLVGMNPITTATQNLATCSVATATTTPSITCALANSPAHKAFMNNTGSSVAPDFESIGTGDLPYTYTGNTTDLVTGSGSYTQGDTLVADGNGNAIDSGLSLANLTLTTQVANAGSTGTTLHKLAKLTGAPSTAVVTATTDTASAIGIVTAGAGTSGNATIAIQGQATCTFDNATTAGDYVQISSVTAGNCHDAGSSAPSIEAIGRVLSTNGSAGTYNILLADFLGSGSGGSGATLQTAGVNNSSQTILNFTTPSVGAANVQPSNPSGGIEQFQIQNIINDGNAVVAATVTSPRTGDYVGFASPTSIVNITPGVAINAQTGTSYPIVTGDRGKVITQSNSAASAYALAQPNSTGFDTNFDFCLQNNIGGLGPAVFTPTSSTINGFSTLSVPGGMSACFNSDNSNWTARFSGSPYVFPIVDASTVTWALGNAPAGAASLTFTVHGGSRTLNITNPLNGATYDMKVVQDATGGEGLTLGTGCHWEVSGGGGGTVTPSTGANAVDLLVFTYDGTNCLATYTKNFN